MSSHLNSSNSVQKEVDLTTPAKNRWKMSLRNLNFQTKKFILLACLKFAFKITFTKPDFM
jgi:hypothetical protein